MKTTATGIIRRFDDLNRIVIPRDIRRKFKINVGEPVEIYTTEEGILLKPYNPEPKSNPCDNFSPAVGMMLSFYRAIDC